MSAIKERLLDVVTRLDGIAREMRTTADLMQPMSMDCALHADELRVAARQVERWSSALMEDAE